jgi:flagellar biosynthesis GTPase FlhF
MFEGWGLMDSIEGENLKWFEMMHDNSKWGTYRAIEKLQQYAVRKNTNELVKCLSTLAEEGDTSSQIELAKIYYQLDVMAAASSQIPADAGDAAAQNNLGRMIAAGQGMPTNWLKDHGLSIQHSWAPMVASCYFLVFFLVYGLVRVFWRDGHLVRRRNRGARAHDAHTEKEHTCAPRASSNKKSKNRQPQPQQPKKQQHQQQQRRMAEAQKREAAAIVTARRTADSRRRREQHAAAETARRAAAESEREAKTNNASEPTRQAAVKSEPTDEYDKADASSADMRAAAEREHEDEAIDDAVTCPITLELFVDPVTTPAGFTYERLAIELHIMRAGTDPQDPGRRLAASDLSPAIAIRHIAEVRRAEHARHDDVRCCAAGLR